MAETKKIFLAEAVLLVSINNLSNFLPSFKVQRIQGMMDATYWTRNRVKIKTQNMADLKKLMI